MTPADKIAKARASLVLSNPFYGALALSLRVVETEQFPTMATNGADLFYNPAFVDAHTMPELTGVVVHEVKHCALMHHTRRKGRDHKQWNEAADYAINRDILAAGFTLPKSALFNPAFDGLSAEAIYRLLEQQGGGQNAAGQSAAGQSGNGSQAPGQGAGAPQSGQAPGTPSGQAAGQSPGQPGNGPSSPGNGGHDSDPGGCGEILDAAPAHDAAGMAAAEAEMQTRVRQALAAARSRGAGKLPGDLEALAAELAKPVLDLRAIVRRFVDESTSRDYSWLRPNRRHIAAGRYLPGSVPDRPSHVVAMVDSSGSMSDRDIAELTAELQAALDEGAADRVTVAYADTRVRTHATYEPGDLITIARVGRGGTAFREPFDWIATNCPDASAILYLTDMDSSDFGEQPAAPVLWIVTGNPRSARAAAERAPFGEPILLSDC